MSDCATLWMVAHQAPLSMGFSKQEHWSGFPCPPPGDLANPGTEPASLTSLALAGRFFTTSASWEALNQVLLLLLSRFSCVRLLATPWTAAYQAPPSMGFSRQEYYSALIISSDWMCLQWTVALSPQPRKEDNCYYLPFRVAMELTRACGSTGGYHLLTAYSRKSSPTILCSPSSYPNDQTHHGAY